jgi:hypothetical protein
LLVQSFLLFPTLLFLLGIHGNPCQQEEKLSLGQINYPILPDHDWAKACPQDTKGSCCSSWDASSMVPPSNCPHPPPSEKGEDKRNGFAQDLQSIKCKVTLNYQLLDCGARKYPGSICPAFMWKQLNEIQ